MSAKLVYKDIAVGAAEDAYITSDSADARSDISKLPFGVIHPDLATLELNAWGGNGKKKIYNGQEVALISKAMSGADCTFSTPPSFKVEFDSNYTTLGISFRFATESVDYPTSLTIKWYRGATLLDQKTFRPDGPSYFCENTVIAFNKLVVTINATNLPYRYARIEQIMFGVVREFTGGEIGRVEILQEVNLISTKISFNTLNWTLQSKTGVNYIFQAKQPIYAYNSGSLIGVFYIDDGAKKLTDKKYTIPCTDAIGVLDTIPFEAVMYSNKNAVEALTEIVNGAFELEIDPSLLSETVTGLNPKGTKRTAIQQIAFAIGAVVDTSGTDKIKIYRAPMSDPSEIPAAKVYSAGSVKTDSIVTAVIIAYHTYTEGSGTSGDDVIVVDGIKYVHTSGTVRIDNPNVTPSDKENIKVIEDATLVNASNVAAVAARVYAYYQRRDTLNSRIVVNGELPGDYVSVPTKYNGTITGHIESMKIKLSNTTAADIAVKAVGT